MSDEKIDNNDDEKDKDIVKKRGLYASTKKKIVLPISTQQEVDDKIDKEEQKSTELKPKSLSETTPETKSENMSVDDGTEKQSDDSINNSMAEADSKKSLIVGFIDKGQYHITVSDQKHRKKSKGRKFSSIAWILIGLSILIVGASLYYLMVITETDLTKMF